jgi:hypothetical protein
LKVKVNSKGRKPKKMKRNLVSPVLLIFLIILIVATSACEVTQTEKPEVDAEALWTHISSETPYKEWSLWPGTGEYSEATVHASYVTTYVNDVAKKAIEEKRGTLPDGTIIVKENYKADKTLGAIAVMKKVEGYNPEVNDWYFAKYKPNGEVDKEEKISKCTGCHGAVSENDYIYTGKLK